MSSSPHLQPIPLSDDPLLRVALAAHLARYTGRSRMHAESDLHIYLRWCADRDINPLTARRLDIELFVRWLQEIRRFKPSTVSRRLSMVIGFYRTCVIDAVLEHSPAEYVRRPTVLSSPPTTSRSLCAAGCWAYRGPGFTSGAAAGRAHGRWPMRRSRRPSARSIGCRGAPTGRRGCTPSSAWLPGSDVDANGWRG
jgi:hypothetical protein